MNNNLPCEATFYVQNAMRFPGNIMAKFLLGRYAFCEDSRAKPNHMACAHFPEKKSVPIIT